MTIKTILIIIMILFVTIVIIKIVVTDDNNTSCEVMMIIEITMIDFQFLIMRNDDHKQKKTNIVMNKRDTNDASPHGFNDSLREET
jgi:hypothetical protein